jgi:hypothetical protein
VLNTYLFTVIDDRMIGSVK